MIEKAYWALILAGVISFSVYSIVVNLTSMEEYVFNTEISLRPISEVPFPAVIIDNNDLNDPMAKTKTSGNIVTMEQLPQEGDFMAIS